MPHRLSLDSPWLCVIEVKVSRKPHTYRQLLVTLFTACMGPSKAWEHARSSSIQIGWVPQEIGELLEEALSQLRDSIQHLHRVMENGRSALVQEQPGYTHSTVALQLSNRNAHAEQKLADKYVCVSYNLLIPRDEQS